MKDVLVKVVNKVSKSKEVRVSFLVDYLSSVRSFESRLLKSVCEIQPDIMREVFKDKEVRKNIRKLMKEEIKNNEYWHSFVSDVHEDIINSGMRIEDEYGESKTYWWVIKGDIENAKKVLDKVSQPWEGVEIHSSYDCTGQWFRWTAEFYHQPKANITFIRQHAGLDV